MTRKRKAAPASAASAPTKNLQAAAAAPTSQVKSEAKLCLDMLAPPLETDVLEWWALDEMKFPALSVMVRPYLGVPATSASAERLASPIVYMTTCVRE